MAPNESIARSVAQLLNPPPYLHLVISFLNTNYRAYDTNIENVKMQHGANSSVRIRVVHHDPVVSRSRELQ